MSAANKRRSPSRQRQSPSRARPPPPQLHKYGDTWWLDDPKERSQEVSVDDIRQAICHFTIFVGCVVALERSRRSGHLDWPATADEVAASSPLLPSQSLLVYRLCALAALISFSVAFTIMPEGTVAWQTFDGKREIYFRQWGLWRWATMTSVAFSLIVLYFAFASWASVAVYLWPDAPSHAQPSFGANAAVLLLGVGSTYALVVTTTVSFVLIPTMHARIVSLGLDYFYAFHPLVMHNANLGLMVGELLLSRMPIDLHHMPFALLLGVAYVSVWHNAIRWKLTHTLMYHFLSWRHPHALKISLLAVVIICAYFSMMWLVAEVLRAHIWGPPLVIVLCSAVMRLRNNYRPPGAAAAAEGAPSAAAPPKRAPAR